MEHSTAIHCPKCGNVSRVVMYAAPSRITITPVGCRVSKRPVGVEVTCLKCNAPLAIVGVSLPLGGVSKWESLVQPEVSISLDEV